MNTQPYVVQFVSADGESTFQIEERVSPTRTKLWSERYDTQEQADRAIRCEATLRQRNAR